MIFAPYAYQRYCIDRLIADPRLGLFLDMGLGKTVITLTAAADLKYNRLAIRKVLVVAPKKVAEATWQAEAARWDHLRLLRLSTVLGPARRRIRALATPADVYITSRDLIAWLVDYYRNDWPFDMLVLDESSSFKNHRTKRWRALKSVAPRTPRIVLLTGTPSPQGLIDLWAQVYLLDGGARLGRTISAYRERYFTPDKRNATTVFSYRSRAGAEAAIYNAIGDICVSLRAEDWLTLPPLIDHDIPVVLDAPAAKAYKSLERDLILDLPDGVVTAQTAAVLTNKLLQLCNGAVYDAARRETEAHRCKLEALAELVEQLHGQPAIVFYGYQHDRDRILALYAGSGLRVRVYRDSGDARAWTAGEVDLLLAHPASCAYGLNLQQGGRHVIWYGLPWSLELYQQAIKRLHRQGQTQTVINHRLIVQGSADEDVARALMSKGDSQEALLDALRARIETVRAAKQGGIRYACSVNR